jgi:hypothetical protein
VVEDEDTDDELLKVAFSPEETKGRSTTGNLLDSEGFAGALFFVGEDFP